jgi:Ca2+-binding EF-hand superfamily protein
MTSLHSRVVVMCLALAAGAGGCATQNSPFGSASEIDRAFASSTATWDLNRDGEVTCEEWRQYASGLFADADANKDGALSRQEFAAMARVDRLFEIANFDYFDADGDGKVTLAEIIDKPNPAFRLLDKNGDCVIGRDERLGERSPGTKGQGKGKRQRGPGGGQGQPGGQDY